MKHLMLTILLCWLLFPAAKAGETLVLRTKATEIMLDEKGFFSSVRVEGKEILAGSYPLVAACTEQGIWQPVRMEAGKQQIKLTLQDGKQMTLKYAEGDDCVTLEIARVPENYDAVLLCPLKVSIHETVGDVIGVAQGEGLAFGMQSLNIKTTAGVPTEYIEMFQALYPKEGKQAELSVGSVPVARLAAVDVGDGTCFQFAARKRSEMEYRQVQQVARSLTLPVEGKDGEIAGAKIALFGSQASEALDRIGEIEVAQGLPHPLFDGEWGKTSQKAMRSYLISNFSENDLDFILDKAEIAGFKYVYHAGPFRDWGHFQWDSAFTTAGDEGVRRMVEKAEARGIKMGVHTLTNFITTNDAYVMPVPSAHLLKQGTLALTEDIDAGQTELKIQKSDLFEVPLTLNALQIGQELITFGTYEAAGSEILLKNCIRGAFGTTANAHKKTEPLYKLWDYPYRTLFPDLTLQDKMADRLAEIFNKTGLAQISFDGLEGCMYTGQDDYATARFVTRFYNQVNHNVLNDASNLNHYTWHIHTRMNWGEPWGAAMRVGQVENRIKNQAFFKRNLFPRMLGWFLIRLADRRFECTSLEDLEWALSESAGFDAGYAMNINVRTLHRHGQIDKLLEAIRNWDTLREAHAFTEAQKERLRDPLTEWHLEKLDAKHYELYPLHISKAYQCSLNEMQPGQPGGADWALDTPYGGTYAIRLKVEWEGSIRNPSFRTPTGAIQFPCEIKAGQYLLYDFHGKALITDKNYNTLQEVEPLGKADIPAGNSALSFSCEPHGEDLPDVVVQFITKGSPEAITLP